MLDNLKMLLGLSVDDTSIDDKLLLIISVITARLSILLGGIEPPEEMEHIILEVAVSRYNRIGSEGFSSHSVEGESCSFNDDDFSPYMTEITSWLDEQKGTKKGRVRFI